jgi:hypothetical protein
MNRSLQFIAGAVAAAATVTLVWMPTAIFAGLTATASLRPSAPHG